MSSYLPLPPGAIASIVTHLERHAPPERFPPCPRPGVTLERIDQPELNWYRGLYREVGEDWLWFTRTLMTDEQLAAIIRHPQVHIHALRERGRDIGLLEMDWREAPDCEIVFFGLVREAIGQGLGNWMMGEAQRLAFQDGGARRLWLHTCTFDHPGALPFYLRQGFRAFKREVEVAADPRLSGDIAAEAASFHPVIPPP